MDEGLCLLTCKELRFIFKSMSVKNVSSFGQYFRRLATLNLNYKYEAMQSLALFTSDYAGLFQLSKNCMGMGGEKGQRGQSHITTHKRTDTSRVSGVHKYEGLVQRVNNQEVIGETHYITHIGMAMAISAHLDPLQPAPCCLPRGFSHSRLVEVQNIKLNIWYGSSVLLGDFQYTGNITWSLT